MTMSRLSLPFLILQLSFLLLYHSTPTDAMKHTFVANHDGRSFIGPIGVPYGFLESGIYYLKVSKFRISSGPSGSFRKNNKKLDEKSPEEINKEVDGLHAGFLLKRFDTESDFANFHEGILEDPTKCSFGSLIPDLNGYDEEEVRIVNGTEIHTDTAVASGPGIVDGGAEGIFLSMNNVDKMWKPNEPTVRHVFTVNEAGYYFLSYQICLTDNKDPKKYLFKEVRSTFRLDFEYMNYDTLGKPSYLTAGEMPLPHMYLYFSVSYAMMLFLWVRSMKSDDRHNGAKPTIYAIHHLMSSVLFLKALSIFFESVRYHFIRVKGHAELWSVVYYGLNFLKGAFLFTVILLIGSGWSFFKPFLSKNERKIIFFVFALQIIDNIAVLVLTHETMGETLYNDWSAVLHLVDIISCCAILVPIVWQVNNLEESLVDGQNEDESRIKAKLALFRQFYLIVVAYIYFTRIGVYLFAAILSYKHTWLRSLATELGTLMFYFMIGIKFRPTAESEYDSVKSEDNQEEAGDVNAIELGEVHASKPDN